MMRPPLVVLAFAAADAASALSADDLAAYRKQLPAMQAALAAYLAESPANANGPLAAFATGTLSGSPASLAVAREAFAPFSNALTELARSQRLHQSGVIHVFECPMVPKVGIGRWLQRSDKDAYNPFFGAEMLHCGGVVR